MVDIFGEGQSVERREAQEAVREKVASVVQTLISEAGMGAVTIRKVAQALGYSTAIVQHYFMNKQELMLYTHQYTARQANERVRERMAEYPDTALPILIEMLPTDSIRQREWRMYVAFWSLGLENAELALAQRTVHAAYLDVLGSRLADMQRRNIIPSSMTPEHIARLLVSNLTGLSLEAVFDLECWPAERQLQEMTDQYCRLLHSS